MSATGSEAGYGVGSDAWPRAWVGPASRVAPLLLNATLVHCGVAVRLTEVEAYQGAEDPASHAYRGRTPRSAALFGPPGTLYVYLSYGLHRAVNVVTGEDGVASGVLLRAGEVVEGIEVARRRHPGVADHRLASGPGNLGRVLAMELHDSTTRIRVVRCVAEALETSGDGAAIVPGEGPTPPIRTGPRVGVAVAAERPWRFHLVGDPSVSAYRSGTRRPSHSENGPIRPRSFG